MVVDTSVIVAALRNDGDIAEWGQATIFDNQVIAPAGIDLEVMSALRGLWRGGAMSDRSASTAIERFGRFHIDRLRTTALHGRIWSLRHNLTAYDAAFVALAEALGAPLATCDRSMARAPGPRCEFITP